MDVSSSANSANSAQDVCVDVATGVAPRLAAAAPVVVVSVPPAAAAAAAAPKTTATTKGRAARRRSDKPDDRRGDGDGRRGRNDDGDDDGDDGWCEVHCWWDRPSVTIIAIAVLTCVLAGAAFLAATDPNFGAVGGGRAPSAEGAAAMFGAGPPHPTAGDDASATDDAPSDGPSDDGHGSAAASGTAGGRDSNAPPASSAPPVPRSGSDSTNTKPRADRSGGVRVPRRRPPPFSRSDHP